MVADLVVAGPGVVAPLVVAERLEAAHLLAVAEHLCWEAAGCQLVFPLLGWEVGLLLVGKLQRDWEVGSPLEEDCLVVALVQRLGSAAG